jgi:hypothetical protein
MMIKTLALAAIMSSVTYISSCKSSAEECMPVSYCLSDLLKSIERFERKDPIHSLFSDWGFGENRDSTVQFKIEVFKVDSFFFSLNELNMKVPSSISINVLSSKCKESLLFEQIDSVPINIEDNEGLRRCYVTRPLLLETGQLILPIRYRTYGNMIEVLYLFEPKNEDFFLTKKIMLSVS